MSSEWQLDYVPLPDDTALPSPYIEVDIDGPNGSALYVCLLDSGASLSAFPEAAADDLGVRNDLIECAPVVTGGGTRPALRVRDAKLLSVRLPPDTAIPIAPYFLAERDPSTGQEYAHQDPILGRDFFLGLTQVAFRQELGQVILELDMANDATERPTDPNTPPS